MWSVRKSVNEILDTDTHVSMNTYSEIINNERIPNNITHLQFTGRFNNEINHLPNSIIHLEFTDNCNFRQSLEHLPDNLHSLVLPVYYKQHLKNLPNSLHYIQVGYNYKSDKDVLPISVREINYYYFDNSKIKKIPNHIEKIKFCNTYWSFNTKIIHNNITTLIFGDNFNSDINLLKTRLQILQFGNYFNKSIDNCLPDTLKELIFGYQFNRNINILPLGLERLTCGATFNQPIVKLPPSLKYFHIGNMNYNGNIPMPTNIIMLNNEQQVKNLIPFLPDILDITTLKDYKLNHINKKSTNIEQIWIYRNQTNLVDVRIRDKINYLD